MTKTQKGVLLIGGTVAAILLMRGAAAAYATYNLNFVPRAPKIRFDGITPVLTFPIDVQNPGGTQLTLRTIFGSVYVNGNYAGNVSFATPTNIQAFSVTRVEIQVRLSVLSIGTQLYDIIQGNVPDAANISFRGAANYQGVTVPLELNYKIL